MLCSWFPISCLPTSLRICYIIYGLVIYDDDHYLQTWVERLVYFMNWWITRGPLLLRTLVLLFNVWLMSALTHSISRMGTPWCAGALHEGCLLCGLCFSVHRFLAIACPSGTVAFLFLLRHACACACDFGATAYIFAFNLQSRRC